MKVQLNVWRDRNGFYKASCRHCMEIKVHAASSPTELLEQILEDLKSDFAKKSYKHEDAMLPHDDVVPTGDNVDKIKVELYQHANSHVFVCNKIKNFGRFAISVHTNALNSDDLKKYEIKKLTMY